MPRGGATAYGVCLFVCLAFRLWHFSFAAHVESWGLKLATQVELRYYLAFQHLKVSYEALFSSYGNGVICSPWRPLQTLWLPLKSKLVTADFLETWWFDLYCRTAGKPSKMTELTVLCCHNYCAIAGTPSYYYMHVVTLAWFCFFVVLALARDIRASIS